MAIRDNNNNTKLALYNLQRKDYHVTVWHNIIIPRWNSGILWIFLISFCIGNTEFARRAISLGMRVSELAFAFFWRYLLGSIIPISFYSIFETGERITWIRNDTRLRERILRGLNRRTAGFRSVVHVVTGGRKGGRSSARCTRNK